MRQACEHCRDFVSMSREDQTVTIVFVIPLTMSIRPRACRCSEATIRRESSGVCRSDEMLQGIGSQTRGSTQLLVIGVDRKGKRRESE